MIDKQTYLYILIILVISCSSAYLQSTAYGIETHSETEEEHKREENANIQNGFSPVESSFNALDLVNKTTQTGMSTLSISSLLKAGSPIIGNQSAPIAIVEFGDFQCKFCGRFATQTEPLLNSTYIQTGKVNLVFKHFVTHGLDSFNAALASQCANDQQKFWNFYEILYNNQGEENSGWASIENLKKFAAHIPSLNIQDFNSCLDSQIDKSLVEKDTNFAFASGFQGTPTFIIQKNDGSDQEMLLGAYPFPSFQAIIEKKLSTG